MIARVGGKPLAASAPLRKTGRTHHATGLIRPAGSTMAQTFSPCTRNSQRRVLVFSSHGVRTTIPARPFWGHFPSRSLITYSFRAMGQGGDERCKEEGCGAHTGSIPSHESVAGLSPIDRQNPVLFQCVIHQAAGSNPTEVAYGSTGSKRCVGNRWL